MQKSKEHLETAKTAQTTQNSQMGPFQRRWQLFQGCWIDSSCSGPLTCQCSLQNQSKAVRTSKTVRKFKRGKKKRANTVKRLIFEGYGSRTAVLKHFFHLNHRNLYPLIWKTFFLKVKRGGGCHGPNMIQFWQETVLGKKIQWSNNIPCGIIVHDYHTPLGTAHKQ